MQKKLQSANSKSKSKIDPVTQRLRRDYSTLESKLELAEKMLKVVKEKKYTLMTQVAMACDYTFDQLKEVAKDHKEIQEAYDTCKVICGMNAYEGIEDRSLSGAFSKYSITKYNKEVREERDRIKQEEHDREIAKIKARQESEDLTLAKYITKTTMQNGQKVHEISVNENIKMPDEMKN